MKMLGKFKLLLFAMCFNSHESLAQSIKFLFVESSEFRKSTMEYMDICNKEGGRIIQALELNSGLQFDIDTVWIKVIGGPSRANYDTLEMRASYPRDTKKATLVHELGHVLTWDLIPDDVKPGTAPTPHYILFLFLYDTWIDLWGKGFAKEQVKVEGKRKGIFNYAELWEYMLKKNKKHRKKELESIISHYRD